MNNLHVKAWLSLVVVTLVMGALLFGSAGTVHYSEAWAYLGVYCSVSALIILDLLKRDRALLKRRMSGGPTAEKERTQQVIMLFASVAFICLLVVPGLDHRFVWSRVPLYLVVTGDALTALSFFIISLVFRESSFTSATIEIAEDHRVISTEPYALVRHPMYVVGILLGIGTPLALGSYWGLFASFALTAACIWRLLDEERLLARNLAGYEEYCTNVRWRLVPGVF